MLDNLKYGLADSPRMPIDDAIDAADLRRVLDRALRSLPEAQRQTFVLHADADAKPVDGGLAIAITGTGRTLAAIQRMIPAQGEMLGGHDGWNAKVEALPNGELLTVTANDPKEVQHIRGLGFAGILVTGGYHQMHHLEMAKGEFAHGR